MIQLKELQNFKKRDIKVNYYVLKIKVLCDELDAAGYIDEEKLMYVLGDLDETLDSVFSTLIERMLIEKISIDGTKVLLLISHYARKTKMQLHVLLLIRCLLILQIKLFLILLMFLTFLYGTRG